MPLLTRFAPAPTGWLHLGHVLNATYVWETACALGGRVLLRIEDHDRERCRAEYEAGILDDLDWLGFRPDVHTTDDFRAGPCAGRQSNREAIYVEALRILSAGRLVYACECSRRTLDTSADSPVSIERPYPGTCRDRGLPLTAGYGWRVRLEDSIEEFDDLLLGHQRQRPAEQCGDLLIRDRRGNWTYQFAVTVDDVTQGIDLVIRGADLLGSTARQIQLARLLGRRQPPAFMHHPLIMKSAGQKLSKSDGDSGIRDLRAAGWSLHRVMQAVSSTFVTSQLPSHSQPPISNVSG
jgi:glutamyl-tRNA synthetase/glutamyl-Q tRNA(Asp) synthetase